MRLPKVFLHVWLSSSSYVEAVVTAAIIFAITTFGTFAHAIQIKESVSDGEINAFIAADELSRIKVIADRIRSVKSNEGEIEIMEDTSLGELYIRPVKRNLEPINIFISTEKNHIYKLLLLPKKMPSEQIFIKNLEAAVEQVISESNNLDITESAIALIKSMRNSNTNYNKKSHLPKMKVNGHLLERKFILLGKSLRGEATVYTNKSKLPVVISLEMFQEKDLVALSTDSEVLEPNQSTNIYIVRRAGE